MFNTISDILMFMLYIVVLGLLLTNAPQFTQIMNAAGANWRNTLVVLQNP